MIEGAKVAGTISGISGRGYAVDQISFDSDTYHFTYGDAEADITSDITRADKLLLVPDFDVTKENYRLSNEKRTGLGAPGSLEPLETSTAKIFVDQVTTDPLAAPLDTLNKTFDKLIAAPGVRKLALVGLLGLTIYFVLRQADK